MTAVTPTLASCIQHRSWLIRYDVKIALSPQTVLPLTALLTDERALGLVLPASALGLKVTGEVLPEVRPVRHGAVPRAIWETLWERGTVVEREQHTESHSRWDLAAVGVKPQYVRV